MPPTSSITPVSRIVKLVLKLQWLWLNNNNKDSSCHYEIFADENEEEEGTFEIQLSLKKL